MGVPKADGAGSSPVVQPQPKAEQAPKAPPAAAPKNEAAKNEPMVKRWQPGEVPDAAAGKSTVFETKSGGGPAAAAAVPPAAPAKGPAPGSYPTVADTQRIADNPDAAARNLDI